MANGQPEQLLFIQSVLDPRLGQRLEGSTALFIDVHVNGSCRRPDSFLRSNALVGMSTAATEPLIQLSKREATALRRDRCAQHAQPEFLERLTKLHRQAMLWQNTSL